MEDRRCFVQFLHPGGEHGPDAGRTVRSWNRRSHKRKFLRSPGRYFDGRETREADLLFWGEWEAQSRVVTRLRSKEPGFPRFLHEPFLDWPPEETSVSKPPQNTDPFVFGPSFLYTCCQQYRDGRPTQLAHLLPGSVILFGSHLRGNFVLDTVFVVGTSVVHAPDGRDLADAETSDTYRLATVERIYAGDPDKWWRLYRGATLEELVDGMFSFFPCRLASDDPEGFPRPIISRLPADAINPRHKQSYKLLDARDVGPEGFRDLWESVVREVIEAGCELGVQAALPRTSVRHRAFNAVVPDAASCF